MHTECLNCNNKYLKNNFCECCNGYSFSVCIDDNYLDSQEYNNVINYVAKATNINKKTIENLFTLESSNSLFLELFQISVIHYNNIKTYKDFFIPKNINADECFSNIYFIFANMDSYFKNLSLEQVHLSNQLSFEPLLAFKNNNLKYKEYLFLNELENGNMEMTINIEYNPSSTIPYDSSLLNIEEEFKLVNNLIYQAEYPSLIAFDEEQKMLFFEEKIYIDSTQDLNTIYKSIEEQILSFREETYSLIQSWNESNKSIFERALLENNLEYF